MNEKITQHHTSEVPKFRAQQVYDWIVPKISEGGGEYILPGYVAACQDFEFSYETLRKALKLLVEVELLTKEGKRRQKFRLFNGEPKVVDEKPTVLKPEVIDEIPELQAIEPEVEEEVDVSQSLVTIELDGWQLVDEQGEKWVRQRELAIHLGYEGEQSVGTIYSRHSSDFDERDSVVIKLMSTDSKEYGTRIFSFRGCLKVCRHSDMPAANKVMDQLYDLADKVRKGELTSDAHIKDIDARIERGHERFQAMLLKQNEVLVKSMVGADSRITDVETEVGKVKTEVEKLNERMEKLINEPVARPSPASAPTGKAFVLKTFPRGTLAEQRKRMGIDLRIINSIDDDRDECIAYKQFTSEMGDNIFVDKVTQSDVERAHRIIVNLAKEWSQRYLHNIEKLKKENDKKEKEVDRLRALVGDANILEKQREDYV